MAILETDKLGLALTDEGDVQITTTGEMYFLTGVTAVVRAVEVRLRLFKQEVFWDLEAGVDYWGKILVKNPKLLEVRNEFKKAILSTPGIESIDSLGMDYSGTLRTLTVTWKAKTTFGETVEGSTDL